MAKKKKKTEGAAYGGLRASKEDEMDEGDAEQSAQGTRVFESAVAIILKKGTILLGLALSDDDRNGKLCFPGGGIDPEDGLDPVSAAIREAYEETGLEVTSTGTILTHPDKPSVAFVVCQYVSGEPTPNQEFASFQWLPFGAHHTFPNIYPQNKSIIERIPEGLLKESESEWQDLLRVEIRESSVPETIQKFKAIAQSGRVGEVGGIKVDVKTSKSVSDVFDGLNPANKEQFVGMDVSNMISVSAKIYKKAEGQK